VGYYDENRLWIEDGQRYIFKPDSEPSAAESVEPEKSKTDSIDESEDREEDSSSEQQMLWKDGQIA
jgi:hypothetical protein